MANGRRPVHVKAERRPVCKAVLNNLLNVDVPILILFLLYMSLVKGSYSVFYFRQSQTKILFSYSINIFPSPPL